MANLINLHPVVRVRANALVGLLRQSGYSVTVTSGYRSTAEQAKLYARFLRGESRLPVGQPGLSTHNYGLAVDLVSDAPAAILSAAGRRVGLVWAGARDPVHFDPFGFEGWRAILARLSAASR